MDLQTDFLLKQIGSVSYDNQTTLLKEPRYKLGSANASSSRYFRQDCFFDFGKTSAHSVDLWYGSPTDVFLIANWKRFKNENILLQERECNGEFKN